MTDTDRLPQVRRKSFSEMHAAAREFPSTMDVIDTNQPGLWKEDPSFPGMHVCFLYHNRHGGRVMARYQRDVEEPEHTHSANLEVYVLEGQIQVWADDQPSWTTVTAGQQWFCPAHLKHRMRSQAKSVLLLIFTGAEPDFKPISG